MFEPFLGLFKRKHIVRTNLDFSRVTADAKNTRSMAAFWLENGCLGVVNSKCVILLCRSETKAGISSRTIKVSLHMFLETEYLISRDPIAENGRSGPPPRPRPENLHFPEGHQLPLLSIYSLLT